MSTKNPRITPFVPFAAIALGLLAGACATSPTYQQPFAAEPIAIGSGEQLALDRLIVIFDASGSLHAKREFPSEKAWVESFVQGMPEGEYDVTIRSFGGSKRRGGAPAPFDREALAASAGGLDAIGESSPLDVVLLELGAELENAPGRTSVLLVSDGTPDAPRWGQPDKPALEAARSAAERSAGPVCFHTVLAGDDPSGEPLLSEIAAVTPCGSYRASSSIQGAGSLASFQREVFVASAPAPLPPVAAPAPSDLDGDGVLDADDACADTPRGAPVDERGCWVLRGIRFGSNSDAILDGRREAIDEVSNVLGSNPEMRLRIEGHTDSTGSAAYNELLSKRRAESVRSALVAGGVDASRLEVVGYGEVQPAEDNATPEGRAANRRIEFSVID